MKNAILIHGRPDREEFYNPKKPTESNDHWFPWLSKQLMLKDIHTVSIEMPKPYQPRYNTWKKELERFEITGDTVLVGHSCGGGFIVRWLSENKDKQVGKVVLVAPWINPLKYEESDTADFFDFEIDSDFPTRTEFTTVFISIDDEPSVVKTVDILKEKTTGINYREFANKKHFCIGDLGTENFPELLEEFLK